MSKGSESNGRPGDLIWYFIDIKSNENFSILANNFSTFVTQRN